MCVVEFSSPQPLDILQVAYEDLVVDTCAQVSRLEEVHTVQIGDVNPPLIGRRAVRAVLLHVHAEEADVGSVDVLKGKKSLGPVGEGLAHLPTIHKPKGGRGRRSASTHYIVYSPSQNDTQLEVYEKSSLFLPKSYTETNRTPSS